jgi:putative transposase
MMRALERAKEMPQSYTQLLIHIVFSTKNRELTLRPEIRSELFSYMGGILRNCDATLCALNGTCDHVHLLTAISPSRALADVARDLKANSSKWMHEHGHPKFEWQGGYSAFSVSVSNQEAVKKYIAGQEEHHKKATFQEEFLALLKKHGVAYNEQYIWA